MLLQIKNRNIDSRYPLVMATCDIVSYYDKLTGLDTYAVNIKTIDDLLSFEAAVKANEESYNGIILNGTTITIQNGDVII